MDAPRFLAYPEADHETARELPYIKDLVSWLEYEQREAGKAVLHCVRARDFDKAFFLQAKADALNDVIAQFWKRDAALPDLEPEDFDHPNLPLAARKNPNARTE
jgi:predicted PolB exonuclease-like 3'-5' exonuclease